MNALNIARHELRRIFVSPLAWAILAVVQAMLGITFVLVLDSIAANPMMLGEQVGVTDYVSGSLFINAILWLLIVIPLLSMRSFSEERKTGTIDLHLSAPISLTELVLGKYLGLVGFVTVMLLVLALMPFSLLFGTPLDIGKIFAGLLGLWLMTNAFAAAGLFISSLTEQPVVAVIATFGLLLVTWIIGTPFDGALSYLSLAEHFDSLMQGVFDSADVIYYILFAVVFLALTVQRLDMERH